MVFFSVVRFFFLFVGSASLSFGFVFILFLRTMSSGDGALATLPSSDLLNEAASRQFVWV